jgi:hypothetical protein
MDLASNQIKQIRRTKYFFFKSKTLYNIVLVNSFVSVSDQIYFLFIYNYNNIIII